MRIKKCENCLRISEYVNGQCMKCGFKEGGTPTHERLHAEEMVRNQTMEQRGAPMRSNVGSIWYTVAFWLPLLGCQFAAAMLSRGDEMTAEALLRTAIKGVLIWTGVIVLLVLITVLIIVSNPGLG